MFREPSSERENPKAEVRIRFIYFFLFILLYFFIFFLLHIGFNIWWTYFSFRIKHTQSIKLTTIIVQFYLFTQVELKIWKPCFQKIFFIRSNKLFFDIGLIMKWCFKSVKKKFKSGSYLIFFIIWFQNLTSFLHFFKRQNPTFSHEFIFSR